MNAPKFLFFLSTAVLVFLYGVAVGVYEIFPYRIIKFTQDSVAQVYEERSTLTGTRPEHFLNRARNDGAGVTQLQAADTAPGVTLISGFFEENSELQLLRFDGETLQRWPVRFFDAFPDPAHIAPVTNVPATNWNTDVHGALALPDGSVVFNFEYGGTVKLDRCGELVWTVPRMTHHSIEQSSDGGFWVPGRRYVETSTFPAIAPPHYEDTILKLSGSGEVEMELSVPQLLLDNGLWPLVLANGAPETLNGIPDLGHLNDIEELSASQAANFPMFRAGDLLLSLRNLNLILVVDPGLGVVRWHQVGPWIRQHDPDFQIDGTITVFNNNAGATPNNVLGGSNIVEISPSEGTYAILYGSSADQEMFTPIRGKHQMLENGNILLTEFAAGRIFEVNRRGQVIWEFYNRFDEENIAEVSQAIRYADDYFSVKDWTCN